MDEVVSDFGIPSETLAELYGSMYKYYPRQWVKLIGDGSKLSEDKGTVIIDLAVLRDEWTRCYESKIISTKLSHILMYLYATWIKKSASTVTSTHAELLHDSITLMLARFHTVKLNNSVKNPVQSIFNLMDRIMKQTYWKLHADITHGKNRFYQLRYNDKLMDENLRHDLLLNDEGEPNYNVNALDFDWDFGNKLTDED